jgi:xanthine dehydrogenase YagS FAD-binding subunit
LFSGCPCLSPLTSNLAIALAALDARVELQRGRRTVTLPIAELYQEAWKDPRAHNSLRPADLILRVVVPAATGGRSAYRQLAEKSSFDWALVSCAAAARVDGRVLRGVRIVLGVVAPVPWRVAAAEQVLEGRELTEARASEAAALLLREAQPHAHNAYKVPLAHALVRRTLASLLV